MTKIFKNTKKNVKISINLSVFSERLFVSIEPRRKEEFKQKEFLNLKIFSYKKF